MLGFLLGLGVGSILSQSNSSNNSKNQVEAFRFEQLNSSYYDAVKKYIKYNKDENKSIWWTKVKGYVVFIFIYENTFKIFYPQLGFLDYHLINIYENEFKIKDNKFIFTYDDELIECKMEYIKNSNNKLILQYIEDNSEMLFKRIIID